MDKGKRSRDDAEHLYQRNGVWYARVTVGGVERRGSLKTSVKREAERRLKPWLKERSLYHGTTRHTFDEAVTLWLEAGDWKPKTAQGYAKLVQVLLRHFSGKFWDQVDKGALQTFATQMRTIGAGPKGPASTATINRYLSVISGIAEHVKELDGWPEVNPVTLLAKKPRKEKRDPYTRAPAADIEAVLSIAKGTFGDLCRVALECGARKDELVMLHRANAMGGQATFYDTKSRVPRTVPWTPLARSIVERQPVVATSPFLFNTRNGTRYLRVTEMWREYSNAAQLAAQKAGRRFQRIRFHDLRHEYAIRYLENGGSLYTLQKLLGHSTIKQTEAYLKYFTPDVAEKVKNLTSHLAAHIAAVSEA